MRIKPVSQVSENVNCIKDENISAGELLKEKDEENDRERFINLRLLQSCDPIKIVVGT